MAASLYNFKKISVVPLAKDFVDFTLSKTQRKTPTEVHRHFKISRIRGFYHRKIKYTQQNFHDRITMVLDQFPKLNDIHPFYSDLINILYDKDHYKLALGQLSTARNLIANVGRDYVRLMKYGDSLYRCKQLKRAALGRMVNIVRKQASSLQYLEQVRQHLSRLPSIDPNTRTILICGFPNVGKSSFINKITRVDAEVQPYAFTTKSLYVGHTDYKYLRWQVIDTPGILDHPLEERNTIEMQAITALAHLKAIVLFVLDISELCNYSIEQQLALFDNIKPLFVNKPLMVVYNKIDVVQLDELPLEKKALIDKFQKENTCLFGEMSTLTGQGVMGVRNKACDSLLAFRVESKLNSGGKKAEDILSRLHVAVPKKRDDKERPICIPEAVLNREVKMDTEKVLSKHKQVEEGADFKLDLRAEWIAVKPEERYDPIPEILNGHNVADFVDPNIKQKLEALLQEERMREEAGFYLPAPPEDDETQEIRRTADLVRVERYHRMMEGRSKRKHKNQIMPRTSITHKMSDIRKRARVDGLDEEPMLKRARSMSKSRTRLPAAVDKSESRGRSTTRSLSRTPRDKSGMRDETAVQKVRMMAKKTQMKKFGQDSRKGESDRHIYNLKPKHLLAGKRSKGKTRSR
ncbi:GTP-binding protein 4-like isoform X1 [Symsagittifera roscoffensis]|uniref:GTP-binding protein 4-like isoform X1 n=1 Tax=Symsagittifera roscoffensis TaxID=84072 RepID=UPI00307C812A